MKSYYSVKIVFSMYIKNNFSEMEELLMRSVKHPDYPDYIVYENGDVVNERTGRRPGRTYIKYKYPGVNVRNKKGGTVKVKIKDLVLEAFNGGKRVGYEARCIDGNEENVHIDNLEWEAVRIENLYDRRLTDKCFRIIETGEVYYNIHAYIQQTGIKHGVITRCLKNVNRRLPDGTHFEFVDPEECEMEDY